MTGPDKYSVRNRDNLQQPFHMQLYEKKKMFSEFFFPFLKSGLNFERFPKKEERDSWFISEIKNGEKGV